MTPSEMGRKGGKARTPKKEAAWKKNFAKRWDKKRQTKGKK